MSFSGVLSKKQMEKEVLEIFASSHFDRWYAKNLMGKDQGDTINKLHTGLILGEISALEALCCAFIIGLQWTVKFEGIE